jgi:fructoselysine-6-P-deglycase FrlB-like protein
MPKTSDMPKPKSKPEPPPPAAKEDRTTIMVFKGSPYYQDWLHRLARHSRQSAATVVDLALVDYARKVGFTETAPLRNPPRD